MNGMAQRSIPGPIGTSCLTCKRRHKKCDQRRPTCTRCDEEGFECLGYSHHRTTGHPTQLTRPKPRLIAPANRRQERSSIQPLVRGAIAINEQSCSGNRGHSTDRSSSTGESTEGTCTTVSTSSPPSKPPGLPLEHPTVPHLENRHNSMIMSVEAYPSPLDSKIGSYFHGVPLPSLQQIFKTFSRIPNSPSNPTAAFLRSPQFEDYIFVHFDRMMNYVYFKPIQDHKIRFLDMVVLRLRTSWIARWSMLLNIRICEGLITDTMQPQLYSRWIRELEGVLRTALAQNPTSPEIHRLQGDRLEARL
ncbi:unnamed protein product [Rhizoctonia solani]|uniref:Zn(2)-C6 fungal-type domain-containing protein n=1 Tax=Rhizoctonia solani TaxID=456999 RepID=A0A8H2XUN9_9AGAM|nr:unnamed protein product [Rhizoctonia solani]